MQKNDKALSLVTRQTTVRKQMLKRLIAKKQQ